MPKHHLFFIRVVGAWRLLLQDCKRLGLFYVEKKCAYVTDGWAEERLVHFYRARNISASSPAADLGCGWWPGWWVCHAVIFASANSPTLRAWGSACLCSCSLGMKYSKLRYLFDSLVFLPLFHLCHLLDSWNKNNLCINCLRWTKKTQIFQNVIYLAEFPASFRNPWSFRNHSNMLISHSRHISYYHQCWKQLCFLKWPHRQYILIFFPSYGRAQYFFLCSGSCFSYLPISFQMCEENSFIIWLIQLFSSKENDFMNVLHRNAYIINSVAQILMY